MIAVGIDPGTIRTGFGVVRRDGPRLRRIASGIIGTDVDASMEARLLAVHEELDRILTAHGPESAAVEDLFFSKNARAAIKLGQVRGVILVTLARRGIPVTSYAPALVKRSVVGTGRAVKEQMQRVVQAILGLDSLPAEDEGDALGIAICHLNAMAFSAQAGMNAKR